MDLSRPRYLSVNDYISKADYTLNYCNVDDAVALIIKAGRSCLLAKTDLVGAFRLIPVHPPDWNLLGFYFDGRYYFDRVLPSGQSSPAIINELSLLLVWLLKHNGHPYVLHYMDDCMFVRKAESDVCNAALSFTKLLCQHLGVPLDPEKTVLPTTRLEFLGVTLDTVEFTMSIPTSKIKDPFDYLTYFANRTEAYKRDILSLAGRLSWCTKCIPASRIFLRRVLDLAKSAKRLDQKIKLDRAFFWRPRLVERIHSGTVVRRFSHLIGPTLRVWIYLPMPLEQSVAGHLRGPVVPSALA
ncbi:hypothetical protein RvY_09027 [Ramazzottius varieornatus]|uniref:Reverse transcriptase domain-containing protein n=1 Tax=Ramazzottius varieornatus TaxID=947166 RepID=A0A1D1VFW6_RAMVA|nr:hypothetical protein RvY_09027 [Ramazzottius varieornatus]